MRAIRSVAIFTLGAHASLLLVACGSSTDRSFEEEKKESNATAPAPAPAPTGDFVKDPPPPAKPTEIAEIFGHSADTLYRLDPETKSVTVIGAFSGCSQVMDIAIDEGSNLYGTTALALYKIDKTSAKCTEIAKGSSYPNSLSFVPKGTVDPAAEALVGFDAADYVRIDVKTGAKTKIGGLGDVTLRSSGDVVSVKGGPTYLTVKSYLPGNTCQKSDCLVEIDPKTGKLLKQLGSVEHNDVFGLSFWAGKLYGFDNAGELFEVTLGGAQLSTKAIPIPQKPAGLSFWGAGSTTSAPLTETPK